MLSEPIRMRPGEAGRLILQLPYSPDHVAKIKTVAGRRWHPKERHWTVPRSDGTLGTLLSLFPGKRVDVDPALGAVKAGSFLKKPVEKTRRRAKKDGITFTKRFCNDLSRTLSAGSV